MKWREFLRPSRIKIVLFAIVVLLILFFPFIKKVYMVELPPYPPNSYVSLFSETVNMEAGYFPIIAMLLVAVLVISYIIASVITSFIGRKKRLTRRS